MKTKSSSGLKVTSGIKAGGLPARNHIRSGLKLKTGLKAGAAIDLRRNHNGRLLAIA